MTAKIIDFEKAKARRETLALAPMLKEAANRAEPGSYEQKLFRAYARADYTECSRLMAEQGVA